MAICNIFNVGNNAKSYFLTFSQYLDDLTRWSVESTGYRVVPSKFIAMDIDTGGLVTNLTERFENGVARFKNNGDLNPTYSSDLFWNCLIDGGYISVNGEEIQYMGDINIQSYNVTDGIGYSEIYCHIPNNAKQCKYQIQSPSSVNHKELTSGTTLEGRTDMPLSQGYTYKVWEDSFSISKVSESEVTSFEVNAIVVMYDVMDGETPVYADIPMGIYITENPITKVVSDESIYNAGTSFGLRICSKYIASSSNGSLMVENVTANGEYPQGITQLLSEMSISQNKMDAIINSAYKDNQHLKDILAIVKNNRTNVPYVKNINGKNYWFVNGRMVIPVEQIEDSNHVCGVNLYLSSYTTSNVLIPDNAIECSNSTSNFYIGWEVKNGDMIETPTRVWIDNVEVVDISEGKYLISDGRHSQPEIKEYTIKVEVDNKIIEEKIAISYVVKSYCGLTTSSNGPLNIPSSGGFLSIQRKYNYTYENSSLSNHIYYMYPASYGELKSITDSRDIEYINDFEHVTKTFSGVEYHIYVDKNPAKVTNYTLKFR
jgi:hypothetical protein